VTRVEVQADLLRAKVYISVLGTDAQQRRAVEALQGAAGRIQALMRADVALRNLPVLDFLTDERFKGTLRTLQIIHEAMTEIHAKEEAAAPGESPEANADAPAPPADETPKTEQP
jgi:ribosome-binding factor A